MATDPPDQALVELALGGDAEAFGALAERYYRMISVLALQKTGHRADAEDIVQETFVRAFRALASLRDGAKFASWIYNIAFVVICVTVFLVLRAAPPVQTVRRPTDPTHTDAPKDYAKCPACHMAGGEGPTVSDDHLNKKGELMLDHLKCYMCHRAADK